MTLILLNRKHRKNVALRNQGLFCDMGSHGRSPRTTTLPLGSQQNASPFCDIFDAVFVRAGFGTLRLGLITGWLPVRVLPAPPRTPALTPSSPSPRNTLDFPRFGAGVMARSRVSVGNEDRSEADWGPSSLTSEIRFPVRGEQAEAVR